MNNFNSDIFNERARELFGETGQIELAQKIGVAQGVISSIKTGKVKSPSADTVYKIATYFGVSTDWLLGIPGATKTIDKATKELCETLGLQDEAVIHLRDNGKFRDVINFLFDQHSCTICEKLSIADLIKRDKPYYQISILEELSKYCIMCKSETDIMLNLLGDGTIKVTLAGDGHFTEEIKTDMINAPQFVSLRRLSTDQYIHEIETILRRISDDALFSFLSKNDPKSLEGR